MARKDYLSNCDPLVKALCNKAMTCGHTKCEQTKKASNMIGSKINIFLSSVSAGTYGVESGDGITTEVNAVEDDKEYMVCANTDRCTLLIIDNNKKTFQVRIKYVYIIN